MNDIKQRLVEVETILKKLDKKSLSKIPPEIWTYINENKDTNYIYEYDNEIALSRQNINVVTIAILTYINMKYLLNEEQKKDLKVFLRNDELIAEKQKSQLYNTNDIFNNRHIPTNKLQEKESFPVKIQKEKFLKRIFRLLRSFFNNLIT